MGSAAAAREISRSEGRGSALLWLGVLGAPLAWAVQLVVNYSLEEWFACSPSARSPGEILGFGVDTVALTVSAVLTAVAVAAGIASVACWRRLPRDGERAGRARWMALAGILNSALYLLLILVSFAPPLVLKVCESPP